jgi:hypothetical protein
MGQLSFYSSGRMGYLECQLACSLQQWDNIMIDGVLSGFNLALDISLCDVS